MSSHYSLLTGLPDNVVPLRYDLDIDLHDEKHAFDGVTTIKFDVVKSFTKELNYIEVNVCELDINKVELRSADIGDETLPCTYINIDSDSQSMRFFFDSEKLQQITTTLELIIFYSGVTANTHCGFHRIEPVDEDDTTHFQFLTQFEATDARKAFPCYDHPSIKADFQLKLTTNPEFTHLSNMPSKKTSFSTRKDEVRKTTLFEVLPKHPTYLVAFTASRLVPVKSQIPFRIPVTTWVLEGFKESAQYSANFTTQCLKFYEELFGIPFPFPKLDNVFCEDFPSEAMENTGMIVYDRNSFLIDLDGKYTLEEMKYCSEIIAHEVAHQWFGNLVTLQDWTDLWLNEAGATFLSWICCDHFYPEWKVWDSFVGGSMQLGLNLDALKSTHPIHYSSCTQDQIAQMFDDISYDKGAALLRMVTKWVGKESLINGLCSYLKEFQWKNATSKDLWSHIEKASGKPVLDVMTAWTEKPGYPKVSVTELAQEGSEVTLELTQKRFFKAQQKDLDSTEIYPIILFIKSGDEVVHQIFDTEKMILKVERDSTTNFYNLNVDHAGFYIINYKDYFQTLFDSSMHMSNQDKIGLISDVVALATTGDVNVTFLIDAIKKWASEGIESSAYWKQLISAMDSVEKVFGNIDVSNLFTSLIEDKLDEVGIEIKFTESTSQHEAKAALFESAVSHESSKYMKIASEMYSKFALDKVGIEPLFRVAVFTSAALTANLESGKDLLKTFENLDENSPSALKAFGRFTDTPMIKYIIYWIDEQVYSTSELSVILEIMSSKNPQGRKMIWEWFTKHWNTIIKMYPTDLKPFQHIMRPCTNGFSTHDDYLMVEDFFRHKDTKGFDMILAQNLETIKYRYEWHDRDAELLNSYFST